MSDPRTVYDILASHRDAIAPSGILDLNPLPRTRNGSPTTGMSTARRLAA